MLEGLSAGMPNALIATYMFIFFNRISTRQRVKCLHCARFNLKRRLPYTKQSQGPCNNNSLLETTPRHPPRFHGTVETYRGLINNLFPPWGRWLPDHRHRATKGLGFIIVEQFSPNILYRSISKLRGVKSIIVKFSYLTDIELAFAVHSWHIHFATLSTQI